MLHNYHFLKGRMSRRKSILATAAFPTLMTSVTTSLQDFSQTFHWFCLSWQSCTNSTHISVWRHARGMYVNHHIQTKTFCKRGVPICNFLSQIPLCKQGAPVCKRGFPICILGSLFLEGVIAKWITHKWAAKPPIFVSHSQVSLPVWRKDGCFYLRKTFSTNSFGAILERIKSGGGWKCLEST